MKYLAAAAILAAAVSPAAAENVFQGDMFFTSLTIQQAACSSLGFDRYDYLRAVFKPANADNGTANSIINLVNPRSASHFGVTGSLSGNNLSYSGALLTSKGGYVTWSSTLSASALPAAPDQTSKYVILKLTINNFLNVNGCNVVLQGVLGPRPGL